MSKDDKESLSNQLDARRPDYLRVLSHAQYAAVTALPDEPLQILAGPGSGKTRVLVSRVAWLILEKGINPRDLIVVTFTNKAANEMRSRLTKLIGPERTKLLVLGTFHATCARYLRQHAKLVQLANNFSIFDADATKNALKLILKNAGYQQDIKPETCKDEISHAKAQNQTPEQYLNSLDTVDATKSTTTPSRKTSTQIRRLVAQIYKRYTNYLRENNALDFDDLLVFGLRLFANNARVIANVQHILVDEFQDTNSAQYSIMSCIAGRGGARGAVSIVGDPDQSIYGWRSAEVGNLDKMAKEFATWSKDGNVRRLFLEENYRSSGSILQAAKGIIQSSSSRIDRGLFTSHAIGPPVTLQQCPSSQVEAAFVATEIKRLMAHSGGLFSYDDFAILLRINALSRELEQQLMQENIPLRILGGARFFDRKEVKDLLAYLSLVDNPSYSVGLDRIINVPKRAIGEKSVERLRSEATKSGKSLMEYIEGVTSSDGPSTSGGVKVPMKSLRSFAEVIKELREQAEDWVPVPDIIDSLINLIGYESHLRKEQDFESRWENVKELKNFSHMVTREIEDAATGNMFDDGTTSLLDGLCQFSSPLNVSQQMSMPSRSGEKGTSSQTAIALDDSDEDAPGASLRSFANSSKLNGEQANTSAKASEKGKRKRAKVLRNDSEALSKGLDGNDDRTPLRIFLEACTLSTDMEDKKKDEKTPKVTISTSHSAKGLEFPVVFVIAVESGYFPFYRSMEPHEIDEEARLLYVAVTRAQTQAYLMHCEQRWINGVERTQSLSPFVKQLADASVFAGGQWKAIGDNVITQPAAGGYISGVGANGTLKKPLQDKVNFGLYRPSITPLDWQLFASILNRQAPPKAVADQMVEAYQNSETAARSKKLDTIIKRNCNSAIKAQAYPGTSQTGWTVGGYSASSGGPSRLFSSREMSPPFSSSNNLTSTAGFQNAGSLISSINRSSNKSITRSYLSPGAFGEHGANKTGPFLSSTSAAFGLAPRNNFGHAAGGSKPFSAHALGQNLPRNGAAVAAVRNGGVAAGFTRPLTSSFASVNQHNDNSKHVSNTTKVAGTKRLGAGRAPIAFPKKPKSES